MATINTSKITGSSLDVASIVSQLMEVERKPLNVLSQKIERSQVRISALGSFQGKLAALQDAVDRLQQPSNFKSFSVTSSSTAVSAQLAAGGVAGLYKVDVERLASNAVINLDAAQVPLKATYHFELDGQVRAVVVSAPPANPTSADVQAHYTALRDAFNGRAEFTDRFVATLADLGNDRWGMTVQGLQSGLANNIQLLADVNGSGAAIYLAENLSIQRPSKDAAFTLNGMSYTRSTNAFELSGLSLNLMAEGEGEANVEVRQSSVNSKTAVENLAAAYNDVLVHYKALTESNVDANLRGVLNSDASVTGLMRQINTQLMGGFKTSTGALSGLSAVGLEFDYSGKLVYKPALIGDISQLDAAFSQGLFLGASSTNNLSTLLRDSLAFSGVMFERVKAEKDVQLDLSKRQATVEEKMDKIEQRYKAQYAALDALLFKLNSTNTALKSALDALTASQKSN
jgi:flagellar hook-associated protein 2